MKTKDLSPAETREEREERLYREAIERNRAAGYVIREGGGNGSASGEKPRTHMCHTLGCPNDASRYCRECDHRELLAVLREIVDAPADGSKRWQAAMRAARAAIAAEGA